MKSDVILPANRPRDDAIAKLIRFFHNLPMGKPWKVSVNEYRKTRSNEQNRYLWGVCYPTILETGGETLAGWTKEDLHDYFLGEHFGWETIEGFGKKRIKPFRRSSKLSTMEFVDFVDFIQQKAAELGIYIPSPNES